MDPARAKEEARQRVSAADFEIVRIFTQLNAGETTKRLGTLLKPGLTVLKQEQAPECLMHLVASYVDLTVVENRRFVLRALAGELAKRYLAVADIVAAKKEADETEAYNPERHQQVLQTVGQLAEELGADQSLVLEFYKAGLMKDLTNWQQDYLEFGTGPFAETLHARAGIK